MKHFVLAPMLVVMTLLAFPFHAFAQDIPEDEEGEEIVIIINQDLSGNGTGRDILPVPINAMLFRLAGCIEVGFLSNIGEVTISLTNLTTGYVSSTVVNSEFGSIIIPFTNCPGIWRMGFLTGDGCAYEGYIIVNT